MTSAFQYAEQDGIAVVTFDLADRPVNVLTPTVLEELEGHLDRLAGRSDLTGLVIATGKADFCAGADVDLMAGIETEAEGRAAAARGQAVFRKLAVLSVPTCAALRGACLGGGLELALACDYRVAVDDPATQLGLPEVRLGIIPGFGGTQRLPRLIPLPAALGMILTGRSLRARPARRRGLVDRLARPGAEVTAARALCRQPPPPRRNGSWTRWPGVAGVIWWLARRRVRKETGERMPAPLAALAAVRAGLTAGEPAGFAREAALLGACLVSPESRNLVRLFQLRRAAGEGGGARILHRLGVVGAGAMGAGIAQVAAWRGHPVRLRDLEWPVLRRAVRHIRGLVDGPRRRGRLSRRRARDILDRVRPTTDLSGFATVDLVIEAVVENLTVKRKVFAEVEAATGPETILATNTSCLPLAEIGADLARPERLVGLHFFNPPHRMPLVEVIRGPATTPEVLAAAAGFVRGLGKVPLGVADSPGFLVNRILAPYLREACLLVEAGVPIPRIDRALRRFGFPMGPLQLLDEVGLEVALDVARSLGARLPHLGGPADVLERLVGAGHRGRRSRQGFYQYGRRTRPAREAIAALIANPRPGVPALPALDEETIRRRCLFPMVNEAARCLEEAVVEGPEGVDLGTVFGIGFPPERGGLWRWAASFGRALIYDTLAAWSETEPRFRPAPSLKP